MILLASDENGAPWPYAPVTIDVVGGEGSISAHPGDPNPVKLLNLRTDANGLVRVYWKMK